MEDETTEVIEVEPAPVKKKKKTYRRRAKVTRAYELQLGKRRVQADDAGVSGGVLYYVVDGVWTYLPVTRKVVVRLLAPPLVAPAVTDYDPPQNFFTRTEEEDRVRSAQFAGERASELENLMRPAFRLAPIEEEET